MKLIKNEKGVSLVELIAGIPLAVILFGVMIMAMMHFIRVYQETKLYVQLQEDLYNVIETVRYGYADDYYNVGEGLIGLITARSVSVSPNHRILTVYPLLVEQNPNYKCEYTVNDDRQITIKLYYKHVMEEPKLIFPSTKPVFFGNEAQFKILNQSTAWNIVEIDEEGNPLMLKIHLEGQVRYRARQQGQSIADDLRQNTRTITYETVIFLGNSVN
ncbi:MAG: hypothetical protein Q7J16_13310 [Candidatus Cloacimonadales bacterium]|nr:hypothetical protein [Candidatus Cloacimonadales bacterium]